MSLQKVKDDKQHEIYNSLLKEGKDHCSLYLQKANRVTELEAKILNGEVSKQFNFKFTPSQYPKEIMAEKQKMEIEVIRVAKVNLMTIYTNAAREESEKYAALLQRFENPQCIKGRIMQLFPSILSEEERLQWIELIETKFFFNWNDEKLRVQQTSERQFANKQVKITTKNTPSTTMDIDRTTSREQHLEDRLASIEKRLALQSLNRNRPAKTTTEERGRRRAHSRDDRRERSASRNSTSSGLDRKGQSYRQRETTTGGGGTHRSEQSTSSTISKGRRLPQYGQL